MEQFQKFSSRLILLMCAVWAVVTFGGMIPTGLSYFFIGLISTWLGIQNIILLNLGQRSGKMPNKIAYQIQRHGERKGLLNYVFINVLLYLCIGIIAIVASIPML